MYKRCNGVLWKITHKGCTFYGTAKGYNTQSDTSLYKLRGKMCNEAINPRLEKS